MPRFRLSNLKLDEISLCPDGDNGPARVVIAKALDDPKMKENVPHQAKKDDKDSTKCAVCGKDMSASIHKAESVSPYAKIVGNGYTGSGYNVTMNKGWTMVPTPITTAASNTGTFIINGPLEKENRVADIDKAALPPDVQEFLSGLEAERDAAVAKTVEVSVKLEDAELKLAELDTATKEPVNEEEDVLEKADPRVKKLFTDLQNQAAEAEQIAKSERDARVTREFVSKAAEFKSIPATAEDFGPVLKSMAEKLSTDEFNLVTTVLKSADEQLRQSGVFKTVGKDVSTEMTPLGKLEGIAKSLQEQDKDMTPEQAFAKALAMNEDAYAEYLNDHQGVTK